MTSPNELHKTPGISPSRPKHSVGYIFNHTMLRVKNITASLDFYTRIIGFSLVDRRDFPEHQFSLYFLAYLVEGQQLPEDTHARRDWIAQQSGVLELTHNHGTESEDGSVYHNGNTDPRGFGHICIAVPDVETACAVFEQKGVHFQKKLSDGRMKSIAFITDPDGYWIEIIAKNRPNSNSP